MLCEDIGGGRFSFRYDASVFAPSTDSFLLADFARPKRRDTVADLGAGAGLLSLLLAAREDALHFLLIDRDEHALALAEENFSHNRIAERAELFAADLRERVALPQANRADYALANPPYFPEGSGVLSPDPHRRAARSEGGCTVDELAAAAKYLLRSGGRFALVHRADRAADIICSLRAHGLEPKRLQFVQHRAGAAPSLLLLEAVSDGKPGLSPEPTLILYDEDGGESAAYRRIYNREDTE